MRKLFLLTISLLLATINAVAQTDVTDQYLTNADLSSGSDTGWAKTGTWADNSGTANGTVYVSENYSGWNSQEQTDFALTQTITLPAGLYKVEGYAFYNATVGNAKLSVVSGSTTLGSVNVAVRGDLSSTGSNDLQKAANSFNSSYGYLNTMYFEVTSSTSVTIGYVGTHDAYREWFVAGPLKLYKYDDNSVCTSSPVDFTTMIFNPSFEYGDTSGWTTTSSSDTGARSTSNATYAMTDSDGSWLFNTWWKGTPCTQTISNLPAGKYALSSVVASDGATIYLISGNDSDEYAYTETTASGTGITLTKDFLLTSAATDYKIGVVGGEDGTAGEHKAYREDGYWWYKCDNFILTYKGNGVEHYAATQSGDAEADTWYAQEITYAGAYTLTTNGTATIVYTQNPAMLCDAVTTTASNGDELNLSVGTVYYKANAATALTIAASSYGYAVGDATVDKTYVQPGQTVTVTFPDAATSDPSASLAQDYSGVTLAGSSLSVTTGEKGFTFTVPSLTAGGEYALVIPANAIGYAAGSEYNTAQSFTLKTPAVYDGTYFLKAVSTYDGTTTSSSNIEGKYLSRGAAWGTQATLDPWGVPINITTDESNISKLQALDTEAYYYHTGDWNCYADGTSSNITFTIEKASDVYRIKNNAQTGYLKVNTSDESKEILPVYDDGTGTNSGPIINWAFEEPDDHPVLMTALRTAATSLSSSVSGLTSKTYLANSPTATGEEYQGNTYYGNSNIYSNTIKVYPGIYKFAIHGFARVGSITVSQARHTANTDCPPVIAFFGDNKVQLKSIYDEYPTGSVGTDNSYNGHYYPNGQGGALTAFQEGKYLNTIWVQVDEETTITYGVANLGITGVAGRWVCYATDGIEITRYYDPETDGLDEEDQLIESLRYTAGDFDGSGTPDATDVQTLVNILLGKPTVDGNNDGVTLADLTTLVNVILGREEARTVDETYTYAELDATVYAEQSASENASGADYILTSAVCTLTNEDVSDKYDIKDYLTTLNITTTLSNVASVSVYAKGQENIAGLMTCTVTPNTASAYSYSAGTTPSVYVNGDRDDVNGKNMQSDVVTVTGSNAGTYTAYLLPVSLSNGVTVTVRTSDGKYYSQDFTPTVGTENNLTFTETTATNNWMATIPGNVNFSMLSTPGAHNAATSGMSSYYECQSESIAQQLANGVRAFDLRPGYNYNATITTNNLYIYHSTNSTGVLYKDAIKTITEFLAAHPTEAVSIIMMKEASSGSDRTDEMVSAINEVHATYSSYFKVLDHSYYTLDEYRGKIFYGCRPAQDITGAVRVTNWPDDASVTDYSVTLGGTCYANVEDAYGSTGSTKQGVVKTMLDYASSNTNRARFHYTYTSIGKALAGTPASLANAQNTYAATYISGTLTGPTGYVYADYIGSSSYSGATLLKAVIDQNYKYVYKGRTRVE